MKGHELPGPHQRKSPAKCPLLAAAPAIIGAVGAMKKKKEEDSPAKGRLTDALKKGASKAKKHLKKKWDKTTQVGMGLKGAAKGALKHPGVQSSSKGRYPGIDTVEGFKKGYKKEKEADELAAKRKGASPAKRADVIIDGKNVGTGKKARKKGIDVQIKREEQYPNKWGPSSGVTYTGEDKKVMEGPGRAAEEWKGFQRKDPSLKKYKTREDWRAATDFTKKKK